MNKGNTPFKKVISVICTVLTVIIVALAAFVIINMIYCRAKNKPVSFFGVSFAIVQTNSMEPYIMTGDLIVFKSCSYEDIEVGDYIVFTAGDGFGKLKGQSIVHAVKEITEDGIITQGRNKVTNPGPDKDKVTEQNLLGICTYNSAGWGKLFSFIGKYGILIVIALVAVPFIVKQMIKIVKLSKNNEEKELDSGSENSENLTDMPPQNNDNDADLEDKK